MACAEISSHYKPLHGQHHRSSHDDFSTEGCNGRHLQWSCPSGITFNVMKDIAWGSDPLIFQNVTNGTLTEMYQSDHIYIADPVHAEKDFEVTVEGVH